LRADDLFRRQKARGGQRLGRARGDAILPLHFLEPQRAHDQPAKHPQHELRGDEQADPAVQLADEAADFHGPRVSASG
jgi:hypothetical protein